ncbi:MAG: hypothetical protein K9W46_02665 [Candidatus Heimdallarchaeum endolithica]|uniref:Flavodoxin-like domain-containing protein n=1 Tax=Candidatus Heimdallarchaeum endolithica TaxID=2876572 RepID=A0A9Y1BS60_9ARCH|nr:MAG: hypothetical protein K9W46_02665 [Candidatus Heimdallarchaeum endolithica]
MNDKKILIVFGSRYGAKEEVTKRIKELLEKNNFYVEIIDLGQIQKQELPKINNYSGLIIGTGIKMSMWVKSVKKFVKNEKEALKKYIGIKAFFVSSAFAADPEKYESIKNEYIFSRLQKYGLNFNLVEAFGGKLDLSPESKMTWLDKKMVEIISKQYDDTKNKVIDLRDWEKVEKFVSNFIELLSK